MKRGELENKQNISLLFGDPVVIHLLHSRTLNVFSYILINYKLQHPTSGSTSFLIFSGSIKSANSRLGITDLYLVNKKPPFSCLNQRSCLQTPVVIIPPTHSDPVSSIAAPQQLNTKPHAREAETIFFR